MKTREQDRMQQTWNALRVHYPVHLLFEEWGSEENGEAHKVEAKKYLNAIKRTATRIHVCGLGQALAFLISRGKRPEEKAYKDISVLTLQAFGITTGDLIAEIRTRDAAFLFAATDEAMAVCGWLSRYLAGSGVKAEESDE